MDLAPPNNSALAIHISSELRILLTNSVERDDKGPLRHFLFISQPFRHLDRDFYVCEEIRQDNYI